MLQALELLKLLALHNAFKGEVGEPELIRVAIPAQI
jgi:hypothetical protein